MSPRHGWSEWSNLQRDTLHPELQTFVDAVAEHENCRILEGFRNESDQEKAVEDGNSRVLWPNSRHNRFPSHAVDLAFYPVDWSDIEKWKYFGAFCMGVAAQLRTEGKMTHTLTWGGSWKILQDYPHFQLEGV